MWGEIEPCTQTGQSQNSCGTDAIRQKTILWGEIEPCSSKLDECQNTNSPEATEGCPDSPNIQAEKMCGGIKSCTKCPTDTDVKDDQTANSFEMGEEDCQESPYLKDELSSCLSSMLEVIAASGSPVKSQQLGEPDLTLEERKEFLLDQYKSKPLVFLERYQAHLKPEHTKAFSHLSNECRVQYYCKEIQRRASNTASRTRVRNHRYAALRALQKGGQYFSEEEMRVRDPLLYEQYIGQYLSEEEIFERSEESMRNGPKGLSDLLINSYQEKLIQNRLEEDQEREQCGAEESDEEDLDEPRQAEWEPNADEKAMLREEFLSQMHQRFLDGKDDFNYSEVDENPDYDNLDIVSRDAEERYFDEDDDDEEEEDDMMQ